MAIYHCSIKIISRGKGKSAVAAAAYRAGEKLTNNYDGITHDYTRKGGVVHTEILLPEHAPEQYLDRSVLWNAVEKIEKAANSQLAREIELALPVEVSREQNTSLVREYVKQHFVSAGMCADVCIHDKKDGNPHAHVLLTMRPFNEDKSWGIKERKDYALDQAGNRIPIIDETTGLQKTDGRNRKQWKRVYIQANDWNEQSKAEEWRAAWADAVNAVLKRRGVDERIDHRSYERQGVEQIPTVHMGVAATQMEQRGIITDRGNQNREIRATNNLLWQLLAKIKQLKDWLKQVLTPAVPHTLVEILQGVLADGEQRNRYGRIRDLKAAARVLEYMQEHNISTMAELREKYSDVFGHYDGARPKVKHYEQRVDTLDEHIRQGGIYLEHRALYAEYQSLKPRKQLKFYEEHRVDLMLFEYAQRYFRERHIGTDFSLTSWREELGKLAAEKTKIYREYNAIKAQFAEVETVRLQAEKIVREAARNPKKEVRTWGMER